MTTPQAPAGWYPAEAERPGEQRYWDGTSWTSAYRQAPVATVRPSLPAIPKIPRWPMWLAIVGVLATVTGGLIQYSASKTSPDVPPSDTGQVGPQYGVSDQPEVTAPQPTVTQPDITPAEANKLQDKGWVLISYRPVVDDYDGVSITARIRNANLDAQTGVFTITLLNGAEPIDTFEGSADAVQAGQVATVDLVSTTASASREAKAGITDVTFQTDTSYGG